GGATMKLTIQKKYLLQSIQTVSNAISSKTVHPILAGMKIEVKPASVVLTGSNSNITIQSLIPETKTIENESEKEETIEEKVITEIEPKCIVIPIPNLAEIIKKLPEEIVQISVEENFKSVIQSGRAGYTLYGQSVEEYPHVDIPNEEAVVTFPAKDLKTFIR